jgi:hypothetical protein
MPSEAQEVARLRRELLAERAERLKAVSRVAGLQSANKKLRILVMDARTKLAKAQLRSEPSAKTKEEGRAARISLSMGRRRD